MKNKICKIIALIMAIFMLLLTFTACKDKETSGKEKPKKPTLSQNSDKDKKDDAAIEDDTSSDNSTSTPSFNIGDINWDDGPNYDDDYSLETPEFKVEDMFDGDTNTYWSPYTTEQTTVEFSLKEETKFNAIVFDEHRSYVTDYIIEAKQSGEWIQIYRQDEMGSRTGVLDKTFIAKDFRLTLTLSDERGGIAEIEFKLCDGFDNAKNFANVGYYTASRLESVRNNNFDEIRGLTDVILFDFASWDKDGNFLWDDTYNEQYLVDMLDETNKVLNGQKLNIWFSLQYFTKRNPDVDTADVLATEESRTKLSDHLLALCDKYGFIGIDIDYEYPHYSETDPKKAWENYDKFLQVLIAKLHSKGYKLSLAMAPTYVELSQKTIESIDRVNVMAYDLIDDKGRHSSYAVINKCVVYFTDKGFKKSQLVMGLPFYTKTTTNEGGQPWSWVINRWRGAIKPWVNSAYTNKYVFHFNGPHLIRDKVFCSMEQGFAGVFCWCMGSDVPSTDSRSLSVTVAQTIERFKK